MTDNGNPTDGGNAAGSGPKAPDSPAAGRGADAGSGSPLPLADQPKRGGLGGILDAILKGLAPTVHRVRRRRTTRTGTTRTAGSGSRSRSRRTTSRSGGSSTSGNLLSLRYHDGASSDRWATTRVAFGRRGNRIAVISSSDAGWWRHIHSDSPVQVRVRNAWLDGRARLVSRDDDTYAKAVGIFIEDRSRAAAERLGVAMDDSGRLDHGPRRPGDAVVIWIEVDAG